MDKDAMWEKLIGKKVVVRLSRYSYFLDERYVAGVSDNGNLVKLMNHDTGTAQWHYTFDIALVAEV